MDEPTRVKHPSRSDASKLMQSSRRLSRDVHVPSSLYSISILVDVAVTSTSGALYDIDKLYSGIVGVRSCYVISKYEVTIYLLTFESSGVLHMISAISGTMDA